MKAKGLAERDACAQVALELYPRACARCAPPSHRYREQGSFEVNITAANAV
jgi:hypothetical protein